MSQESLTVLQRLVDGYAGSIEAAMQAVGDASTPAPARRVLCGALNYVLDLLDIFPDHYKGLGVVDDAMLLRLAAKQAVEAGAQQPSLRQMADEVPELEPLLGELLAPLSQYVAKLPERTVRGRTVEQILGDKTVLGVFTSDVQRQVAAHKPQQIETGGTWSVNELKLMIKHELKKAGLL